MSDDKGHEGKKHGGGGHGGGHGGGGGAAHEEHEGAPEWLISFADNVALLMGFFVILLAMNMKEPTSGGIGGKDEFGQEPNDQLLDMVISIRSAFHNPVDVNSTDPRDLPMIRRILERGGKSDSNDPGALGDKSKVQTVRPGDYYSPTGSVNFDDGVSRLSPEAEAALRIVAGQVRGGRSIIEVRGHASAAEAFRNIEGAYRLSYERALAAARVLADEGVSWDVLRVVACADGDRIQQTAYDASGHRANQRAEVIVTHEQAPLDPYARDRNSGPPDAPPVQHFEPRSGAGAGSGAGESPDH